MTDATRDKERDTPRDIDATHGASGVTITAAAQRLGVSVRTVQRRLDSGVLRSIERDGRRLVCFDSDATQGDIQRDTVTRHATENDATRDTPAVALLIEQQSRDRAEISFLRGLVEQHQRSEAELRASLREALKAMPKQLTQGAAISAQSAPISSDNSPREQIGGRGGSGAQNAAGSDGPTSYAAIADWLEGLES